MAADAQRSLTLSILKDILQYIVTELWRFLKYRILRLKHPPIIYGRIGFRKIFDFPIDRNGHTAIGGKTGFGKSALAVNLAVQNINQSTRTVFIDPHGDPEASDGEKGASVEIYTRARSVKNLVFLSVNQTKKVIGYNPLFLLASIDKLDDLKDDLLNALFFDTKGFQVDNSAEFILDSVLYFHNAYFDWLLLKKNKDPLQAKTILKSRQFTINDLAHLEDNPAFIDLFVEILGYKASTYHRPDLVALWLKTKEKSAFDAGFKGATGRLKKVVSTAKSKLFFESYGFNLLEELQKKRSVLCDLSKLDNFTTAIISKLVLTKVYSLHMNGILKGQTEFYIDEASNVEMPSIPQIITQGRKNKLALTLIYQFTKQFTDPYIINAIKHTIVTRINFRNSESDLNAPQELVANLKKRHFIFENARGIFENVRTINMPPIRRKLEFVERGAERDELRERMMTKRTDIFNYFTNV